MDRLAAGGPARGAAPPIPPAVGTRPTWSVVIPVHDCAGLLPRALGPVLEQLGTRAQVVVVDDASSDDPRAVAAQLGGTAVHYERNARNLGAAGTFNRGIALAGGELVHLLHGDDEVLPGFYSAMEAPFRDPSCAAVVCRTRYIDADGRPLRVTRSERRGDGWWDDALGTLAVSNRIRPSSIVVRRSVYEQLGGFRVDLAHAADWEMWTRIAAHGRIWYVDRVLGCYRVHASSDTAQLVRVGANIRDRVVAIHEVNLHVPPSRRTGSTRRALGYAALFAWRTASREARARRLGTSWAQAREGARCAVLALVPARSASLVRRWRRRVPGQVVALGGAVTSAGDQADGGGQRDAASAS
jgi:glycosyltransferase involved in cell wall biosynthesis